MSSRLIAVLVFALLLIPTLALAGDPAVENSDLPETLTAAALEPIAPIREIRAPLSTLPAITAVGATFRAELAIPDEVRVVHADLTQGTHPTLLNGGWGGDPCGLEVEELGRATSAVWADTPDLSVRHFELTVTRTADGSTAPCPVGPYELNVVLHDPVEERTWFAVQPNAVHLLEPARFAALASGAAEPKIVVLADPQVGDPRPFQDATEDAHAEESPAPVAYRSDGVLGDGSSGDEGRWKAFREALRQAAAEKPDFVIVAGDLTFGQAVPGSYAAEYAELYEVLLTSEVPLFLAPGNHDGYVANGMDGFAYWRAFIGPTHYLTEVVPGTHLLVMNTYDWSELDRLGMSFAVSAWGGQVREGQLTWMHDALAELRSDRPDDRVLAVSHHSPSWRQDRYHEADPTGAAAHADGTPVAEQVTRGAVSYGTTDQAWSGENRLELRDLLREFDVEIAFAGHTHRDRIARDDGAGRIVETHQSSYGMPEDYDPRELHYFTRDDQLIPGLTQPELAELIRTGAGPLYVDTTTALSGTTQYWGYRVAVLEYGEDGHLVLENLGEPMTEERLQALARAPELFNPEHSSLGLFSKPLEYAMSAPWVLVPG